MPEYTFTGAYPRVLAGLSQGVNAEVLYSSAGIPPYGSTVEAYPGDGIRTKEPYAHPELAEVEAAPQFAVGGLIPNTAGADTIPVPVDQGYIIPAPAPEPAPADPAHDAMTAEGAPAPAEPTL